MARKGQFTIGNDGRPKGATNKLTKTVKETVLAVFNEIQHDPKVKLSAFAKQYPRDFYQIAAKLIPTEVQGTIDATLNWNETKVYETAKETN
jgi:hypothetical protein